MSIAEGSINNKRAAIELDKQIAAWNTESREQLALTYGAGRRRSARPNQPLRQAAPEARGTAGRARPGIATRHRARSGGACVFHKLAVTVEPAANYRSSLRGAAGARRSSQPTHTAAAGRRETAPTPVRSLGAAEAEDADGIDHTLEESAQALRDLVEATIWRQASAITVPTVGQSSAPPLPPQTPTATPPRTVGQRVPRPPIPLIGG